MFQCNNPQTKEPKLKSAVRIVKEWPDYDNEIRRLQERVAAGKTESSNSDKITGGYLRRLHLQIKLILFPIKWMEFSFRFSFSFAEFSFGKKLE